MKGIARFAEYSVSGGLLWLNILLFMTLLHLPDNPSFINVMSIWKDWLTDLGDQSRLPSNLDIFSKSLNTIAVSLFVLLVFCTGLLLDLMSPLICSQLEVMFFRNSIKISEQKWLDTLVKKHEIYLHDDYAKFIFEPLFSAKNPKIWNAQKKRASRINAFLMAYIFVNSNSVFLTQLTDKMQIWYTCRSITTSLLVLCLLLNFLPVIDNNVIDNNWKIIFLTLILPIFLLLISISITIGAYLRVNNDMLALAYHIYQNKNC